MTRSQPVISPAASRATRSGRVSRPSVSVTPSSPARGADVGDEQGARDGDEDERGLFAVAAIELVDEHPEEHDHLGEAVERGVEQRADRTGAPGGARERAIEEVEGAGEQQHDPTGQQGAARDERADRGVAGQPRDADGVGGDAQRDQQPHDRVDDRRWGARRQEPRGHRHRQLRRRA